MRIERRVRVHSMTFKGDPDLETGDKAIVGGSVLAEAVDKNLPFPLLFQVVRAGGFR